MYNKTLATIFITSIAAAPTFASHFFQKSVTVPTKKASTALTAPAQLKSKDGESDFSDFSGTWTGSCTGIEGTETITIENSDLEFIVDDKIYPIGSLETEASSSKDSSFFYHTLLEWSADHSNLIFNSSYAGHLHMQDFSGKSFGYQTGTISLKENQMIMEISSQNSEIGNGTTVCTYDKQ